MRYAVLFCFLAGSLSAAGQTKLEREYRIRTEAAPEAARAFVSALSFEGRVRWYVEESLEETSVEAKTKHQGQYYSIEFDSSGRLQDIEVEISREAIPLETRSKITTHLDSLFSKNTISKIQIQYTGNETTLQELIKNGNTPGAYAVKYELIVKGSGKNGKRLYEFLFSETGLPEKMSLIVLRNTDNLEY